MPETSLGLAPVAGVTRTPTIAAIATGSEAAAIGIVRLSGPRSLEAARVVAPGLPERVEPRRALLTSFFDAEGRVLDRGLVIYFEAPRSFTGEDVVELHLHGSPRLLRAMLARLVDGSRARLAEPGEFTRRAYLNGRIDLAQAEAVGQLLAASSERGLRAAAAQLAGGLSLRLRRLRSPLLALTAEIEATLDFPDETAGVEPGWGRTLRELAAEARALRADAMRGALLRRRPKVVLYGPVNAGKSTLFNRLLGADRALVDEEAGTTRDALEGTLELEGVSLTLVDTAGLREGAGRLETQGIARTRSALESSDLAVLVLPPWAGADETRAWRREVAEERRLEVLGMADLRAHQRDAEAAASRVIEVSGRTGTGLEQLIQELVERLAGPQTSSLVLASERQEDALRRVEAGVAGALAAFELSTTEVVAGELRAALESLEEVLGGDVSEAILDAVFSRFCIGK